MAGPAGRGGDDVRAALGDVVDDLGVVVDVGVGGIVDVLHGHAQLGIDLHDQILDHGVNEACLVGLWSDVAVLISPLVLGEDMHLGAIHLEVVDELCQGDVGIRLRVAQNHSEGLAGLGCGLQTGKQGGNQNGMGVHHNLNIELGMPPGLTVLQFLAAHLADALADLTILKGDKFRGAEAELGSGLKDNFTHFTAPFL